MKVRTKIIYEYIMLTIGSIIVAFAIEEFLMPNTILDGGVVGIGMIINSLTNIPLSILTIILNTPFLLIGAKKIGKRFILKSFFL